MKLSFQAGFDRFRAAGVKEPAVALTPRDKLIAAGQALLVLLLGYERMVPQVCGAYPDEAIQVASAFPLAHHYRAVLAWGP